jgi:hypothetical protein
VLDVVTVSGKLVFGSSSGSPGVMGNCPKSPKLQELVLTGQVDIMQPLIEQPNDAQMSQQQKILSEMLAQQPMASMASSFNQSL